MKSLLSIFFCFILITTQAQDTTYFDSTGTELINMQGCKYFSIVTLVSESDSLYSYESFFCDNKKRSEYQYVVAGGEKRKTGLNQSWFRNGQLKQSVTYQNNAIDGELITFWNNGQLKRKDYYDTGRFQDGQCWDKEGTEIDHYDYEIMPVYVGGESRFFEFLQKNIQYPPNAKDQGVSGTVYVGFVINTDGNVENVKILRGIGTECDEEVIRLISSMPKWIPGKIDGELVKVQYSLPVHFRLGPFKKNDKKRGNRKEKKSR
jgi:protein TonB